MQQQSDDSSQGTKKYLQDFTDHTGHRRRMYARLESDDTIADHELLEIFLFGLIPRKNTNGLAHVLIRRFGGLDKVFKAEKSELMEVDGIGEVIAEHILSVRKIFFGNYSESKDTTCNINELRAELVKRYKGLKYELLDIYAFGASDTLVLHRVFTIKNSDLVTVDGKKLSALLSSPKVFAIIAAHNHPESTCFPSTTDNAFTRGLQLQCSLNGVKLYDHLIVDGQGNTYSYLDSGELATICENFNAEKIVDEH